MSTPQPSFQDNLDQNDRLIAFWEIGSVTISALLAEWAVSAFADNERSLAVVPIFLALGLMLFSHYQRQENLHSLGFRFDNFWPALRLLLIPTAIVIVLLIVGSWLEGGLMLRPVRTRLAFIPVWALFQQYALQGYINRRAQLALGDGISASLLVGAVFGVLHLPSLLLGLIAFVGGLIWAEVYRRQPNLLAIALSHTAISWTLSLTIPSNFAQHLRIGFKFFGCLI
jgi:membrane protease YdiL (CAAX protease family)